jgi:hypothetical protein
MKTRSLLIVTLCLLALMGASSYSFAQATKEKLQKPDKSGVTEVDAFVNKSFDAYEESLKITEGVSSIKYNKEAKTLTNANGEPLTKESATLQLGELLVRAKKQNDNIQAIQDMQKAATESVKKCSIAQKPKATKNMTKGGEALNEVVSETKKQIELIDKQIDEIKAL